ncbi:hypothetical protein ALC56_01632 [Trachymyrmex septentrionalis]|uniref:Odorant receptor 13a n=1 Tax=Trachymyrmex septentrionalis TaxID=34720 RepID=A0A195FUC7_9HYME|nr:hypothetical protein ALC56_01632 [Trachymyrmex septentrionalis]
MERYAKNSRRYSLGYSLYYYFGVYTFISLSLIPQVLDVVLPLNESRPILPIYPGYYFVDERKYFFCIFSHAIMAWEIAVTVILSHDCMLLTYIEHICSIFTLVGFRFERLIYNNTMKMLHSRTSDMYCKQIAFSVYTHRKALKFAQLIGDTFSLTLTIQLALNTIMISITLLQVTQQHAGILELIRYMMYVIGQLIHLFCLSFEGQKLIDHSLQTRDKIPNVIPYGLYFDGIDDVDDDDNDDEEHVGDFDDVDEEHIGDFDAFPPGSSQYLAFSLNGDELGRPGDKRR